MWTVELRAFLRVLAWFLVAAEITRGYEPHDS